MQFLKFCRRVFKPRGEHLFVLVNELQVTAHIPYFVKFCVCKDCFHLVCCEKFLRNVLVFGAKVRICVFGLFDVDFNVQIDASDVSNVLFLHSHKIN